MRANGFTLVELMVVIALLALAASVAMLTVGGGESEPHDSATRFAGRLAAARDEAIMTGRPVQAWVSRSGYGFDQHRAGAWQPLGQRPFGGADWPAGTTVPAAVRLRFDSLGLPDGPAALQLSSGARSAVVRIAANGEVSVQ